MISAHFRGKNKSGAELDTKAEHDWQVRDGRIARMENSVADQDASAKGWT